MDPTRSELPPRSELPVGILASRLVRDFEAELSSCLLDAGYRDLRTRHTVLLGSLLPDGQRITALAAEAGTTAQATSELVDDLEKAGYVSRLEDPSDRRAKLIVLTERGNKALADCVRLVSEIEGRYIAVLGREGYENLRSALARLLASTG